MGERGNNQRAAARTRKMRARSYRLIRFFISIIFIVGAFAVGFMVRDHPSFLQSLGFPESVTGLPKTTPTDASANQKDVFNSLSMRVDEVEDILANDSLDQYSLDTVTERTMKVFSASTDDPYLRYYSAERYKDLMNDSDEGYAGVGVLFSEYNGQAYVVDVFEGSQAQLEGVQEGDFVVSVNGDRSQSWSRSEVAAVLSQLQGTTVVIAWRRPESLEASGGKEFTTSLYCEEIPEPNVTAEYDEERTVGYIKLQQLTQNATPLVQSAIESLVSQGARSLVLDLRNNPGGYLNQAVGVASLFIASGNVVEIRTKDGKSSKTATGQPIWDGPLVVIVNRNTSNAAEVLAAALKESDRATLVGTTTMGKGSVQVVSQLSFGGALRYTAAYYLTPEGHDIDKVGVEPEITFEASEEGDSQRDFATELAASMIIEQP